MNTKNDAWGKCLYDKLCPQKHSWISSMDVTLRANQLTFSFCFPIRYDCNSDIEFNTVMKIKLKKFELAVGRNAARESQVGNPCSR